MLAAVLAVLVSGATRGDSEPPFRFEACDDCGIQPLIAEVGMGTGVAAADFDDDGDVDLFVPTRHGEPDHLYMNLGDGRFADIAQGVGLAWAGSSRCAIWFDSDADHRLDLLVANDDPDDVTTYRLYRQTETGTFVDATSVAGLMHPLPDPVDPVERFRGGMAAGDLDNDGDLDLVTTMWNGYPEIWRNDDGVFTEITAETMVTTPVPFSHQAVIFDATGDGWQDIYIAVDFRWNVLATNRHDGTFDDIAPATRSDNGWNDMGIAIGDEDRDGDLDLYVTNITAPGTHNILLRQHGTGEAIKHEEISNGLGVADGGWGWGATFLDADLDGWLDLAATNGWSSPNFEDDVSRLFWNRHPVKGGYADVASSTGFDDTDWGSALIALDIDRDGDPDLVQACMDGGPLRVLRNEPTEGQPARHWVLVRPRMLAGGNPRAIGAIVRIEHDGIEQMRLITAGISYLGQEPAEALFGLGDSTMLDRVTVEWPDGRTSMVENVVADEILDITDATAEQGPPVGGSPWRPSGPRGRTR